MRIDKYIVVYRGTFRSLCESLDEAIDVIKSLMAVSDLEEVYENVEMYHVDRFYSCFQKHLEELSPK